MVRLEKMDYIILHTKIRKAQRVVLGIEYVYYFYNEDTTYHFHTWYVPRYEWMYELGRSVESVRPVLLHARNKMNNDDHKQKVLQAIDALKKELNRCSSKYFNVFCIFNTIDNTGHHQAQVRLGLIYYPSAPVCPQSHRSRFQSRDAGENQTYLF